MAHGFWYNQVWDRSEVINRFLWVNVKKPCLISA
jgi:hypothetical protein